MAVGVNLMHPMVSVHAGDPAAKGENAEAAGRSGQTVLRRGGEADADLFLFVDNLGGAGQLKIPSPHTCRSGSSPIMPASPLRTTG